LKIGLQVPRFTWPGGTAGIGPKLAEIARTADAHGFSSLWVMDHFYQVGQGYGAPDEPMLEGYTALSYMAAVVYYTGVQSGGDRVSNAVSPA